MQREIKFRVWNKKFTCWDDIKSFDEDINELFKIDNLVFQQYTGLKDKNGKEIYEGDIIYIESIQYPKITPYILIIEWCDTKCGWNMTPISYFDLEIIGNIFENPDLIK